MLLAQDNELGREDGVNPAHERRPARLALVGLSELVDDILTVLIDAMSDFEICVRLESTDDISSAFDTEMVDIMICSVPEPRMRTAWEALLQSKPLPAIINLTDGQRSATSYFLREERREVAELSAASLREALALGFHRE